MYLYKYKSLTPLEYFLDIILHERLYCSEYPKLNDPFEGVFVEVLHYRGGPNLFIRHGTAIPHKRTVEDLPLAKYGGTRVCSLTSDPSDVRLWSNYADAHKGVAIELNFPSKDDSLVPVNYYKEPQKFSTTLLGSPETKEVLSKKTHHWLFESEYRIIQKEEYFSVAGMISRVITGPRISDDASFLLDKVIPDHIPIYGTYLDLKTMSVKINTKSNTRVLGTS